MQLDELAGADVVLLGVGVETLNVLPHLRAAGVGRIRVVESAALAPDRANALADAGVGTDDILAEPPATADVVLRSPGYPAHRADVVALRESAPLATTPTGLWLAVRGGRRTVAVTGTKGKSSTVTLIAAGLAHAGLDAFVAGNIGTVAWSHDPHRAGIAVVELSSYHAADLIATAEVTILTLLAEDHLDWHGSVDVYHHDKLRVLSVDQADGTPPAVRLAPVGTALPDDLAGTVTPVPTTGDYRSHNIALAVAGIRAAARLAGHTVPDGDELTARLSETYPELPARFAVLPTDDGIRWVDDALGSNPSATAAALERIAPGPAVLIAGGRNRAVSLAPVLKALDDWPRGTLEIVWMGGDDDQRLAELVGHSAVGAHRTVDTMVDAVRAAAARAATLAGGPPMTGSDDTADRPFGDVVPTVVFSPLAPTPPGEGVWSDRSQAFQAAVAAL